MSERPIDKRFLREQVQRLDNAGFHWNLPGSDVERGIVVANLWEGLRWAIVFEPEPEPRLIKRERITDSMDLPLGGWTSYRGPLSTTQQEHFGRFVGGRVDSILKTLKGE